MAESSTATKPTVMFKKGPRRPNKSSRKRSASPAADDAGDSAVETAVVRPTKKSIANPLVQGSKRRRTEEDMGGGNGLDEFDYAADTGSMARGDELATRSADWDLESLEKKKESGAIKVNEDGEIVRDDGLYHGQRGYLSTINKRADTIRDSKMKTGPIRVTSHIRTITLMDYQPDVCKPYKETGFCGYGDSCKFMHDRGDYLAGWQLDQLDPNDEEVQEVEEEEEMLPFACLICKKEFTEPVVTKCGHYFCMQCAIDRFIKSPKCYACGAATNGIFNKAEKLLAKLEAKRKRRMEEKGIKEDEEEDTGIEIGGGDSDAEGEGAPASDEE